MKITTKGQVTIPQALRQKHGLWPHTEVRFVERHGKVVVEKSGDTDTRGGRLVQALRGQADVKMTTEQIMRLTRGR